MNATLAAWNDADAQDALAAMLACCASQRWAAGMVMRRPLTSVQALSAAADEVWAAMDLADWMEAFSSHPRIGDRKAGIGNRNPAHASAQFAAWSRQEQAAAEGAEERVLSELAQGNAQYEATFGFTYIVCATGKGADEMLTILKRRLESSRNAELKEAAEQQRQITQIRLGKWLMQ